MKARAIRVGESRLPPSEREQLLSRFEAHASARPDHPLMLSVPGPQRPLLTYGALWDRATSLAARWRDSAASVGDLVALDAADRATRLCDWLALWILAAVPVPLSPRDTAAYRRRVCERAGIRFRLVDGRLEELPVPTPAPADAELAYLAFTSGSTGEAAGARIRWRGVPGLLRAQVEAFGLTRESRALTMLDLGFDATVSDLFTALFAGATLVCPAVEPLAPSRLIETLHRGRVTHADIPPSYLRYLDVDAIPAHLETLIVGGEVPPASEMRRLAPHVRLWNVYGPTEATVCTSLVRATSQWREASIGAPIPGIRYALAVDAESALVSEGSESREGEGELWIAGDGVAQGYHRDPGRTAERFVWREGTRWYRTGDRVRRTHDAWVYLGRLDRELELHGQRVAPEQVEAALCDDERVAGARVALDADARALVAHVELRAPATAAELRERLRERVPSHLCPSRIVIADALPRNARHKVAAASEISVAAHMALGGVMGRQLRRAPLAMDDDFFDLGADSFDTIEVAAAMHALGFVIAPGAIAEGRTPRGVLACAQSARSFSRERCRRAQKRHIDPRRLAPGVMDPPRPDVFITGLTGTLGRATAPALLRWAERERVRVHALCRREPSLAHPCLDWHRGDLRDPEMGLSRASRASLSRVGLVVHLAANVKGADSFDRAVDDNAGGTAAALSLAHDLGARFLHASTLSLFTSALGEREPATGSRRVACEADDRTAIMSLDGSYAASKWISERLVFDADPALEHSAIVRLGLLTDDDMPARADHLAAFVRGCVALGRAPVASPRLAFDVTPVDEAGAFVAALVAHHGDPLARGVFHFCGERPAPYPALRAAIEDVVGERLDGCTLDEMLAAANELQGKAPDSNDLPPRIESADATRRDAFVATLAFVRADASARGEAVPGYAGLDLFASTDHRFDRRRAHRFAESVGLRLPGVPSVARLRRLVRAALVATPDHHETKSGGRCP